MLFNVWLASVDARAGETGIASQPNLQAVLGVGAVPGTGDPSSFRLGLRGEWPVVGGDVAGLGVVLPVEVGSSGDEAFGFEVRNTALEVAPSIRGRLFPESLVRLYLDLGAGLAFRFSSTDTWFGSGEAHQVVFMGRSALGLEIGGDAVALVLEPIGYRHYGLDESGADVYAAMAGIQVRL